MTAVPTLMKLFDATEIFRQGIRALGIKNVDAFKLQPNSLQAQVMQQEELMKKVQEGNAVPVKGQGAPAQFQALQHMLGPMAGGRMNLQARGM